jgi:hypothetical protein
MGHRSDAIPITAILSSSCTRSRATSTGHLQRDRHNVNPLCLHFPVLCFYSLQVHVRSSIFRLNSTFWILTALSSASSDSLNRKSPDYKQMYYRAPRQPFWAYVGLIFCSLLLLFNGWHTFYKINRGTIHASHATAGLIGSYGGVSSHHSSCKSHFSF